MDGRLRIGIWSKRVQQDIEAAKKNRLKRLSNTKKKLIKTALSIDKVSPTDELSTTEISDTNEVPESSEDGEDNLFMLNSAIYSSISVPGAESQRLFEYKSSRSAKYDDEGLGKPRKKVLFRVDLEHKKKEMSGWVSKWS